MNGVIGSAVTEQTRHANRIGIVMFQPLLAAERIADRRLQFSRQLDHLIAGIPTPIAAEDRYRFRVVDHRRKLIEICIGGAKNRRAGNGDFAVSDRATSADATSPGIAKLPWVLFP